jgi:hypothetical protein
MCSVKTLKHFVAEQEGATPVVVQKRLSPPEFVVLTNGLCEQRGNGRVIGHHQTRNTMRRLNKR